ncbi:hypothetical protein ACIA98_16840 [Streptomyces sp. NPDC051366]|uniref:hypothetical protein n=1 Tax=Streptomyces sp. NPDC051366 TaxID=3365652 RepID=UPI00378E1900
MNDHEVVEYAAPGILPIGEFSERTMWYGWATNDDEGHGVPLITEREFSWLGGFLECVMAHRFPGERR